MKVLLVNNHHKILGGAERYYFELSKLLVSKGHIVGFFSTKNQNNKPSKWQRYFIEKIDFTNIIGKIRIISIFVVGKYENICSYYLYYYSSDATNLGFAAVFVI